MKYLNTFNESIKDGPQIGDYVICDEKCCDIESQIFTSENIGQIFDNISNRRYKYVVKYDNVPENLQQQFSNAITNFCNEEQIIKFALQKKCKWTVMSQEEVIFWSKNKEDCETYLISNKYNL